MMFSEAKGQKVVDTSSADTVGRVSGFLVDPSTHSVVALQVKKSDTGDVIRWRDVTAFGTEAVTISDVGVITDSDAELAAISGKDHELLKKRVLSAAGDELGSVRDVDFDHETGVVTTLVLGDADDVDGDRLIGVGSYAVVVRVDRHEP